MNKFKVGIGGIFTESNEFSKSFIDLQSFERGGIYTEKQILSSNVSVVNGCLDELEDGNAGCINDGEPLVYDESSNPDPNNDNYNVDSNPNGTQGNQEHDYDYSISELTTWEEDNGGEKFEAYYDYGSGELSPDEENYLGNNTLVSVPSLFYFDTLNNLRQYIHQLFDHIGNFHRLSQVME